MIAVHNGKYKISNNFKEMLKSGQAPQWLEVWKIGKLENLSLLKNYDFVKRKYVPAGAKTIPGRYVSNIKVDTDKQELFKVRMVAKCYLENSEKPDIDAQTMSAPAQSNIICVTTNTMIARTFGITKMAKTLLNSMGTIDDVNSKLYLKYFSQNSVDFPDFRNQQSHEMDGLKGWD
ncbi:unnamed protein product [Ambrosiozyma monospora]|uniref:Unnamed protein product n=1 Tax=Ambrosiozyma monospora TaxID=43982 RepID=A0A9W6YS61_AMBMO|nr:unnamed protein product [Ambrosiozyma monospora]